MNQGVENYEKRFLILPSGTVANNSIHVCPKPLQNLQYCMTKFKICLSFSVAFGQVNKQHQIEMHLNLPEKTRGISDHNKNILTQNVCILHTKR